MTTWTIVIATALVGIIFLCAPRLYGWQLGHVHKEDGTVFLSEWTLNGWSSVTTDYTGYLHVVPRLLTALGAAGPPGWFPIIIGFLCALWRAWLTIIAFVAFRSRGIDWRWSLAAGSMFLFVPVGQQEVLGNLTNLRWFCDAGAVVILIGQFRRFWVVLAGLTLALCALTDPLILLLFPLFLWAVIKNQRESRFVPILGGLGALGQWLALKPSARSASDMYLNQPIESIHQLVVRGPIEAQYGQNGAEVAIRIAGVSIALILIVLPAVVLFIKPRLIPIVLAISGIYLLALTLIFADLKQIPLSSWFSVGQASRYAVPASILIGAALILSYPELLKGKYRPVALLSAVLLVVAIGADATGDRYNTQGPEWSKTVSDARASCTKSGTRLIVVPLTPSGVPTKWTAKLPCTWLEK
ncbi:hypothetical protein V3G39_00050 (plasmid) [Dermatophilaceae bacterium Sec6.4]